MSTSARENRITNPATPRGQQTRQGLLDAAEAVFGEKGFERASIVEITRRAGVAQGTFYVYFPDKKAVFTELVKELSHRLRREIAEAVGGLPDRLEVERAGFRVFFNFIHNHRNMYKIVRQAEFVDEELFRWYYRRFAEGYVRGLERAMEAEQIRSLDSEFLAYCLMGIGDFLGMRWILWRDEGLPDEILENMIAFIHSGMALRPLAGGNPKSPEQAQ
ncbi:MAG: TetR/AcrR family transcriptional regulator [Ardenticatenaceae bacterium]|nr:TetR/AcrR family transcriptional regulator [Ardenticatenaceae bacterium]